MTEFLAGNSARLLECGNEYFPALLAAIDSARHEIFLETYIFADDDTGNRVAQALLRAVGRRVRVHLLVDGFGSRAFVDRSLSSLTDGGVRVLVFRREYALLSLRRRRLRRLHRKIAVIDGKVAFVGGINIIDDIDPHGPAVPRLDYAVQLRGPIVRPILRSVDRLWRLVAWASFRRRWRDPLRSDADTHTHGSLGIAFLTRDNIRHRRDIEDAYLAAIETARREIWIACAYFLPRRKFRQALTDAAARGVQVNLVLQGRSEYPILSHATRALYPHLLRAGVHLHEYHRSFLHAKIAIIDGHWSTVGSSNIDPFSLLMAREANVVIDDRDFALALRNRLMTALEVGVRRLEPADWDHLPAFRRLLSWIAYHVLRWALETARISPDY